MYESEIEFTTKFENNLTKVKANLVFPRHEVYTVRADIDLHLSGDLKKSEMILAALNRLKMDFEKVLSDLDNHIKDIETKGE